ncbi:homoserine kinase [Litchfieldia salsa]|uniref:Homoserine kinase n=1 Tax=Litchfieldia salsa TaxID=930152 RepID=A0A1H0WQD3_9BACI|nr:homoserine kinase [Litchfieldia salsa]SDP92877.1 homoserine kinase [Litchfieldia salsa]
MNDGKMFQIKVPGSTANLGPGFDSIGLAVNRYLTLVVEPSDEWQFIPLSKEVEDIPTGKDNFVYRIAEQVAAKYDQVLPPCKVKMTSDIPLARGLGSSAAAIIAAIELVDHLCGLTLSKQEKLRLSSEFEGHPDNVGASLFGGLVIGSHRQDGTDLVQLNDVEMDIVVVIPRYEVMTKEARAVLPTEYSRQDAVAASSISNVLVAALATKNWDLAGKMMDLDLFHQPYRQGLIPDMNDIVKAAKLSGAFGVALSGAGPTVICFAEAGQAKSIVKTLAPLFGHFIVDELRIEKNGSQVSSLVL